MERWNDMKSSLEQKKTAIKFRKIVGRTATLVKYIVGSLSVRKNSPEASNKPFTE